jgi:uncharacterized protein with FMN-binding domain
LFAIHLVYQRFGLSSKNSVNNAAATLLDTTPSATIPNNSAVTVPTAITVPTAAGQYKDGSYTGIAADAYYGYIQVQATVKNGRLADVTFLQYPNDQRESVQINTRAMPLLKAEAISAQSASVDVVSRATDTSFAFKQSLASALAQAKS